MFLPPPPLPCALSFFTYLQCYLSCQAAKCSLQLVHSFSLGRYLVQQVCGQEKLYLPAGTAGQRDCCGQADKELVGGVSQSTFPGTSGYRNLRYTCNHCCFEATRLTTRLLNYGCMIPLLECLFHVFLAAVEYCSVWFMSCTCMYMNHACCIQQSITIILIC